MDVLVRLGGAEHERIGEKRADDLQSRRQAFARKTTGYVRGWLLRQIERICEGRPLVPAFEAESVRKLDAGLEGGKRLPWCKEQKLILEKSLHALSDRGASRCRRDVIRSGDIAASLHDFP